MGNGPPFSGSPIPRVLYSQSPHSLPLTQLAFDFVLYLSGHLGLGLWLGLGTLGMVDPNPTMQLNAVHTVQNLSSVNASTCSRLQYTFWAAGDII